MAAEFTRTSKNDLVRKATQLSAPAAAVPCSMIEEGGSSDDWSTIVLISLLAALASEVMSADVVAIAVFKARRMAERQGVPFEEFDPLAAEFMSAAKAVRSTNPLSRMF